MIRINKVLRQVKNSIHELKFSSLNPTTSKLILYTYASYKNLPKGGSQGAYILLIADDTGKCCPIAWNSTRIKRVVRSTLAAETLALADGQSAATFFKRSLGKIFPSIIPQSVKIITDNKSLYDSSNTTHSISDKELTIDMNYIREKLDRKEMEIYWKDGSHQICDVLTKRGASYEQLCSVLHQGLLPSGVLPIANSVN